MAELNRQPVEEGGQEVPGRWSTRRKGQAVLRMLRGESIGELCRSLKVPVRELEEWREPFLRAGLDRQGGLVPVLLRDRPLQRGRGGTHESKVGDRFAGWSRSGRECAGSLEGSARTWRGVYSQG
jgi:hypothetical protein